MLYKAQRPRYEDKAGYSRYKKATMPAALFEMGFISNDQDLASLLARLQQFAQGIYNGILDYLELTPKSTSQTR